jgi:hypothetical protein
MSDSVPVSSELDDVLAAARRLPACDGAAKLHALIARLLEGIACGANVAPAADALAQAATAALVDDPWVQFEVAVRQYHAKLTHAKPLVVGTETAQVAPSPGV